jgi:hypothetical protein
MEMPTRHSKKSNAKLYLVACLAATYVFSAAIGLSLFAKVLR